VSVFLVLLVTAAISGGGAAVLSVLALGVIALIIAAIVRVVGKR
jgi:hypothetical protein